MHLIAPVVSNSLVVWSVVGLLMAWAAWSAASLVRGTRTVARALEDARRRIEATPDALRFAGAYEGLSAELEAIPLLGPRWREYRDALLVPAGPGRPVRATSRADAWFDSGSLFRAARMDMRYHAALPNLLVGAGLLFTFLGLAAALGTAGGIVAEGATQAQRNADLKALLDTASFKFITSLAGLFLSIAYALLRKDALKRVDAALDGFVAALDARVPLITPAALQEEANRLLTQQGAQLESFSTELAVNIGSAFDKAFDQRLGEHIGPLAEAMQRLASGMSSRNEDAIQTMLNSFLERLQGGAGDRMQQVTESLAMLGSRLEGLQTGLGDAAVRMAQSADAMASRMGEGAEAALSRITDQMGGVAEALRAVAEQTRSAGADAGDRLSNRIEAAAAGFENAANRIAETLSDAAAAMQRRMGDEAEAGSARLTAQFESMVAELRALADASRAAGATASEALAERIGAAATTFEATAAKVAEVMERAGEASGGALGRGAEEAVGRIAEATEGMRTELRAMVEELRTSMSAAGDSVRVSAAAGGDALRDSLGGAGTTLAAVLDRAAKGLASSGTAAAAALQQGGEAAGGRIEKAGSTLATRVEGLGTQARLVGEAAERLAVRIGEFERAAGTAAGPLADTATDLKAAGTAVRDALQPLQTVAASIRNALDEVAGAARRLETTQAAGGKLMEGLAQTTARFEGVDRELARTLDELQKGLKGFTDQVRTFVTQTDTNLAKGTLQLGAAVKQLEETLGDFLDQMKPR
jgi:hypothetical protein